MCTPLSVQFFLQFHAVSGKQGQIIGWCTPFGVSPPLRNSGSATVQILSFADSKVVEHPRGYSSCNVYLFGHQTILLIITIKILVTL